MNKSDSKISVRSSAAEYLTFIAATGESGVEAVLPMLIWNYSWETL